jgi:hypothetical protein
MTSNEKKSKYKFVDLIELLGGELDSTLPQEAQ